MFQSFADEFYRNFIFEQRWRYLSNGLLLTLELYKDNYIHVFLYFINSCTRSARTF